MAPTYIHLPKNRENALKVAVDEFYDCKKQVKQIEQEIKTLNERLEFIGTLLSYGVNATMFAEGALLKKVEAAIGKTKGSVW